MDAGESHAAVCPVSHQTYESKTQGPPGSTAEAGERSDPTHHCRRVMNVQYPPCGCRVTATGARADPLRIEFCPVHNNQRGTIAVTLVRMDQLKSAIQARDW